MRPDPALKRGGLDSCEAVTKDRAMRAGPDARAYIGCSGFVYNHWRGDFYPEDLPSWKWLEYYAGKFNTVELNVTFYRLPKESTFQGWRMRTGRDFTFVIKGSRLITHLKQLRGVAGPLDELMTRGLALKDKLGLVLWQLKPRSRLNLRRLKNFIRLLRKKYPGVRQAFEFRHPSWFVPQVYGLLRDSGMTFCMADAPAGLPEPPDDFPYIYVRRHGPQGMAYTGSYGEMELRELAKRIRGWIGRGKDVYVYFNNDLGGYAPKNALRLKELVQGRAAAKKQPRHGART